MVVQKSKSRWRAGKWGAALLTRTLVLYNVKQAECVTTSSHSTSTQEKKPARSCKSLRNPGKSLQVDSRVQLRCPRVEVGRQCVACQWCCSVLAMLEVAKMLVFWRQSVGL